eukprot:2744610-Rhodomonas_salina.1
MREAGEQAEDLVGYMRVSGHEESRGHDVRGQPHKRENYGERWSGECSDAISVDGSADARRCAGLKRRRKMKQ